MIKNNYNHPMYLAPEQSSDDTGMYIALFGGLLAALSVGIDWFVDSHKCTMIRKGTYNDKCSFCY